jgi:hypothetical protein
MVQTFPEKPHKTVSHVNASKTLRASSLGILTSYAERAVLPPTECLAAMDASSVRIRDAVLGLGFQRLYF